MISPHEHHYSDLKEKRKLYEAAFGPLPLDSGKRYEYYLNMMDAAITAHKNDPDANYLRFPFSIGTKQELIRIIMFIQEDIGITSVPVSPVKKKFWRRK